MRVEKPALVVTHYAPYDLPGGPNAIVRAVCGDSYIRKREASPEPSCAKCRQWLREDAVHLHRFIREDQ